MAGDTHGALGAAMYSQCRCPPIVRRSGYVLPKPRVSPEMGVALWALPGSVAGHAFAYLYGARWDAARGIDGV